MLTLLIDLLSIFIKLMVASGHVGGEKAAWYWLLVHAHPETPGNLGTFGNG